MDEQTTIGLLRAVPSLHGVDGEALAALVRAGTTMTPEPGSALLEQGHPAPGLVILLKGAVKALRQRNEPAETLLVRIARGPAVLIDPSVLDGGDAEASWIAALRSVLLVVPIDSLPRLLTAHACLDVALLAASATELRAWAQAMDGVVFGAAEDRLARLLERMALELGVPINDGRHIAVPIRRRDLAQMANITTETASRLMAKFEREGRARSTWDGIWWRTTARLKSTPPPAAYEEQEGPETARAG